MSTTPIAAIAAVLVAAAVGCVVRGVRPRRRTIAEVRALLHPAAVPVDGRSAHDVTWSALSRRLAGGPLGAFVAGRLGSGLVLIGSTPVDVISRVLVGTTVGVFGLVLTVGALIGAGLLSPSPWWSVAALVLAPCCALVMWSDITGKIERRRLELRRATNDFVQLTSVGLTTDQSAEAAIAFALSVGDSEMFELLRNEIRTAPARGVPLWEALDTLGRTHDLRELTELASSIERQGMQGVSITDTVTTLAASMRAKSLDELERSADRANANLSGPTIAFVVTTIVFLAYPLAIRIGEAFS